ncbi:MAG: hypothetical protein P8Y71_11685 [Pseudolabrys sp.]|jgi:hypothetical protein
MQLARVIPGTAEFVPVNVFACAPCGIYYSEASREPPAAAQNEPSGH